MANNDFITKLRIYVHCTAMESQNMFKRWHVKLDSFFINAIVLWLFYCCCRFKKEIDMLQWLFFSISSLGDKKVNGKYYSHDHRDCTGQIQVQIDAKPCKKLFFNFIIKTIKNFNLKWFLGRLFRMLYIIVKFCNGVTQSPEKTVNIFFPVHMSICMFPCSK